MGAFGRQALAVDARAYYKWGIINEAYFRVLDFGPFTDPDLWRHSDWSGTHFVGLVAGIGLAFIGQSWLGLFAIFTTLQFVGSLLFIRAYRRASPEKAGPRPDVYPAVVLLMPSLWFWPSSVGKEALLILAMGLVTAGYVGKHGRSNWALTVAGLALTYCVRQELLLVLGIALALAALGGVGRWTTARLLQTVLLVAVGLSSLTMALDKILDPESDVGTVQDYVAMQGTRNDYGGSSVAPVGSGLAAVPMAIVNTSMRPFIWEAHNSAALVSAIELMALWVYLSFRRRGIAEGLRRCRSNRVLRFSGAMSIIYVVALGLTLANLGLMARQRSLLFPFLFMFVELGELHRRAKTSKDAVLEMGFTTGLRNSRAL